MNTVEYRRHWNRDCKDLRSAIYKTGANEDWEHVLQFNFLMSQGLKRHHRVLDVGCGCLRGSVLIAGYVGGGNFWGLDVAENILRHGHERYSDFGGEGEIRLEVIDSFNFKERFSDIGTFDFVTAISLVTHLLPDDVGELFSGVRKVLRGQGRFFFSIIPSEYGYEHSDNVAMVKYREEWIKARGRENGLAIESLQGDYENNHGGKYKVMDRTNTPFIGQWVMEGRHRGNEADLLS